MTVQQGDIILYGKYAGTELKHEGVDYIIMKESEILAILKNKKNGKKYNI